MLKFDFNFGSVSLYFRLRFCFRFSLTYQSVFLFASTYTRSRLQCMRDVHVYCKPVLIRSSFRADFSMPPAKKGKTGKRSTGGHAPRAYCTGFLFIVSIFPPMTVLSLS